MDRQSLIDKISTAISQMEGFTISGTLAERNANPGNIRSWKQANGQPYPQYKGYVDFVQWANGDSAKALEEGWRVLKKLVGQYIDGRYHNPPPSFYQMFSTYAPASDANHPKQYAEFVAKACGTTADTVIQSLIG